MDNFSPIDTSFVNNYILELRAMNISKIVYILSIYDLIICHLIFTLTS